MRACHGALADYFEHQPVTPRSAAELPWHAAVFAVGGGVKFYRHGPPFCPVLTIAAEADFERDRRADPQSHLLIEADTGHAGDPFDVDEHLWNFEPGTFNPVFHQAEQIGSAGQYRRVVPARAQ